MKKKHIKRISFSGKLGEVKETLFTVQGSPFYFIPKNKDLLIVLRKWCKGTFIRIYCYKMAEDSQFFSVSKIWIDQYKNAIRATTRQIVALAELERTTVESKSTKRHLHVGGFQTGLSGKGVIKKKKEKPSEHN